jgi:hypothetical protein
VHPPDDRATTRCWECGRPTDQPATVTLRTALHVVTTLTLCARCYRTHYVPLTDGTLLIEPADPGSGAS